MSVTEGFLATVFVAGVLAVPASVFVYRGLKHRSRYRQFRDASLRTPTTVTPGETALVTGQAKRNSMSNARGSDRSSVTGPLSQKTGVLTAWEIHTLYRYGRFGVSSAWAPEALAIETEGFSIVDGSNQIVIPDWSCRNRIEELEKFSLSGTGAAPLNGLDVDGVWMETETHDRATRLRPDEEPPKRITQLESRADVERVDVSSGFFQRFLTRILSWVRTPEYTRRYRDITVESSQTVSVLGTVREPVTPGGSLRMTRPDEDHALITTVDPQTLERRYRRSYWKWVYGLPLFIVLFASLAGLAVAL